MPGVVRQGDLTTGEGCYPPSTPSSWSPDVFANGLGVVRNSDSRNIHCCGIPCHGATYVGTCDVYVNGLPIQRQGDPLSCGDTCGACSSDVIAG